MKDGSEEKNDAVILVALVASLVSIGQSKLKLLSGN